MKDLPRRIRVQALSPEENVAFDVAYKLVRGGTLPEPLYRLAVDTFGQHGHLEGGAAACAPEGDKATSWFVRPPLLVALIFACVGYQAYF